MNFARREKHSLIAICLLACSLIVSAPHAGMSQACCPYCDCAIVQREIQDQKRALDEDRKMYGEIFQEFPNMATEPDAEFYDFQEEEEEPTRGVEDNSVREVSMGDDYHQRAAMNQTRRPILAKAGAEAVSCPIQSRDQQSRGEQAAAYEDRAAVRYRPADVSRRALPVSFLQMPSGSTRIPITRVKAVMTEPDEMDVCARGTPDLAGECRRIHAIVKKAVDKAIKRIEDKMKEWGMNDPKRSVGAYNKKPAQNDGKPETQAPPKDQGGPTGPKDFFTPGGGG